MMNIIGYFVDEYGDKTKAEEVFVCINIHEDDKFEYYCPVGQHGEGHKDYLACCKPITKEEYLEASKGYYTPSDYIGVRLSLEKWKDIFRNLKDMDEEDYYDGVIDWVEVVWLDGGAGDWCLCFGEELFEDGFASEKEAQERLNYLEQTLL